MSATEHLFNPEVDLGGIYETLALMEQEDNPADLPKPKQLNEKAMTVRLTTSRPTTVRRDEQAEAAAQAALGDKGITAQTRLFRDKANPIRQLLAEVSAVYHYHKLNTIPYIDRGPRLLPVENFENYRDNMRRLMNDVENKLRAIMPHYYTHVDADIVQRNGTTGSRASRADYPTAEEFESAIKLKFEFAPLPDYAHSLFDIAEEERVNLETVHKQAISDLFDRLREPLDKLVKTLNTPNTKEVDPITGKEVRRGIFRDTTVTNVVDAVQNVKALAMGDEKLIAACDMLATAMGPIKDNTDSLRESPVVREMAAKKLAEVQSRMAAFFGGGA